MYIRTLTPFERQSLIKDIYENFENSEYRGKEIFFSWTKFESFALSYLEENQGFEYQEAQGKVDSFLNNHFPKKVEDNKNYPYFWLVDETILGNIVSTYRSIQEYLESLRVLDSQILCNYKTLDKKTLDELIEKRNSCKRTIEINLNQCITYEIVDKNIRHLLCSLE